jgi:hypothetical protein
MKSLTKSLLCLFAALALFAANLRATPLDFALTDTIDAGHYAAGASAVKTIRILSINYITGVCRFQLLDAAGAAYGAGAVYGLNADDITEGNSQAKIIAAISI